jgi:hypothetical protein
MDGSDDPGKPLPHLKNSLVEFCSNQLRKEQIKKRETIFSPCRLCRYTLWREWYQYDGSEAQDWKVPYVQFIGLNPSTADETLDDPTIRRCIGFAKSWGYGAMCMTNLFAWRDTQPANMKLVPHPIGPDNDKWLLEIAQGAGLIVAAWGKDGSHLYRGVKVKQMLPSLHCFKLNQDGTPQHPLYLKKTIKPIAYR